MAQLDSYLKRICTEYEISYLDDFYDVRSFVQNDDLSNLMSQ